MGNRQERLDDRPSATSTRRLWIDLRPQDACSRHHSKSLFSSDFCRFPTLELSLKLGRKIIFFHQCAGSLRGCLSLSVRSKTWSGCCSRMVPSQPRYPLLRWGRLSCLGHLPSRHAPACFVGSSRRHAVNVGEGRSHQTCSLTAAFRLQKYSILVPVFGQYHFRVSQVTLTSFYSFQ